MAVTFIIKVYADAVIAGTRTFISIPKKSQTAVLEELNARVEAGVLTEDQLNQLIGE